MSHTPGPWKAEEEEPYDLKVRTIALGNSRRLVADIPLDDAPVRDYNDESWANARLIAAAPELLAAARAWATNGWCVEGPKPKPGCACDWHLACAAVTKAEGR